MINRRARLAAALAFLALAAAGAAPGTSQAATLSPPPAQISIKLLQVPRSEASDPRASQYIIDRLAPGTVIHRQFQVANPGSTPVRLTVYPAAATIFQGIFQFAAGHTQNEMTTWVTTSQGTVNLAPHSYATLTATVTVPRDAPSGEQYGVIWAQEAGRGAGNVTLVNRVGIRLYLSVGAGGAPPSAFTLGTPAASRTSAGAPIVRVPVRNTGGRALDIRGTLQLSSGPGDISAGPFPASSVITIAPGQSADELFQLSSKLPDGPWQATFTMVSGLLTQTDKVTLDFTGGAATGARIPFPVVLVAAILAVLVLLAAAAVLITRSRRTRRVRTS